MGEGLGGRLERGGRRCVESEKSEKMYCHQFSISESENKSKIENCNCKYIEIESLSQYQYKTYNKSKNTKQNNNLTHKNKNNPTTPNKLPFHSHPTSPTVYPPSSSSSHSIPQPKSQLIKTSKNIKRFKKLNNRYKNDIIY